MPGMRGLLTALLLLMLSAAPSWAAEPLTLERQGFTRADSGLDEHERILKRFETALR